VRTWEIKRRKGENETNLPAKKAGANLAAVEFYLQRRTKSSAGMEILSA
jgi:hypothetical protein